MNFNVQDTLLVRELQAEAHQRYVPVVREFVVIGFSPNRSCVHLKGRGSLRSSWHEIVKLIILDVIPRSEKSLKPEKSLPPRFRKVAYEDDCEDDYDRVDDEEKKDCDRVSTIPPRLPQTDK